jgi:choline dehydrogenase-like flavoprotein
MQRRKFIKNAITGLPILLLAPSISTSSCRKDDKSINPNDKTVFVIGAGISGLAAAKKLKEKGFNVIVLESQDKVGGRLRTNRTLGLAFDEGASWIHGTNGNPITALAKQAGMNTAFTDDESRISYDIGGVLRSAILTQVIGDSGAGTYTDNGVAYSARTADLLEYYFKPYLTKIVQ